MPSNKQQLNVRLPDRRDMKREITDTLAQFNALKITTLTINDFVLIAVRRELDRRKKQIDRLKVKHPERWPDGPIAEKK